MDPYLKKRKPDENGALAVPVPVPVPVPSSDPVVAAAASVITRDDYLQLLEPFTKEQIVDAIASTGSLSAVRYVADRDLSFRKLFIRGLGWETTADNLRTIFSPYGELQEAVVITDKSTGRSKGYGFIVFRHSDSALLAIKEPSKKIDGRMTVTQFASQGTAIASGRNNPSGPAGPGVAGAEDISLRKIFVADVPAEMSSDRLLTHFSSYGEIEEGPLGFDKQTGKFRGFALFVYKTTEGAQASLVDPIKIVDGYRVTCKLAGEGKRQKLGGPLGASAVPGALPVGAAPMSDPSGQYVAGSGSAGGIGMPSYGQYQSSAPGLGPQNPYSSLIPGNNQSLGISSASNPAAGSIGSVSSGSYYGNASAGSYGAMGSGYRMQPSSVGLPSVGGFGDSLGHYPTASSLYRGQDPQQTGVSPGAMPRVPPNYPSVPPYY